MEDDLDRHAVWRPGIIGRSDHLALLLAVAVALAQTGMLIAEHAWDVRAIAGPRETMWDRA